MGSLPTRPIVVLLLSTVALAAGVVGAVTAPPVDVHAESTNTTVSNHPPSVAQPANTTSYLRVPDDRLSQTEYTQPSVDVPGALAIDRDRLQARLAAESFETKFENASSTAGRTAAVTMAIGQYERMVEAARQRQQDALAEYSAGRLTARGLARNLARASANSEAIADGIENVRTVANRPLDYGIGGSLDVRFTNMKSKLVTLDGEGRVRSLFRESVTGQRQPVDRVYIEAGDSDLVLATILRDKYLRESYIGEAYDPVFVRENETSDIGPQLRITNLYTWGFKPEERVFDPTFESIGNTSVWGAESIHEQGQFMVYLDTNTNNIFKERQTKRLEDVRPRTAHTQVNGSLRLVVNETHDTGPTQVRLLDNETDQPRNGTVYVDETPVGTTGNDGQLWIVDSHGDSRIRAETADGSVSMVVFETE